MNILCSPINQKTRDLARQADMSETFVHNIVCAWQAANNSPDSYPSLDYIKSRNRDNSPDIYYATPVYSQKQYNSNEPLIKRNADNSISLLTLDPNELKAGINLDKKQEYLNRFFEAYKHIGDLKDVVGDSLGAAYRFMLWTELAKTQLGNYKVSDTSSKEENEAAINRLAELNALNKLKNYVGDTSKQAKRETVSAEEIKPEVKSVPLKDLQGKLASTDKNNVISIADNFTLEEFFDYITGKVESPTSQQKQEVFRRMGTYGYPIELLKAVIKTVDDAKKFLQYHEESHITNRDRENYWSEEEKTSSKRDYMAENKLAIETRATLDAIKRFLAEKGYKKEQINTGLDLGRYISWQSQHITKSPNFKRDHKYLIDGKPISYSITELRDKLWPKNIQGDHSYAAALGNSVDAIVRDYFDSSKDPKTIKYPNISDFRKESLLKDCARIEQWIHKKWGKNSIIITSEFALAGKTKFNDKEVSVAGTMDMLVIGEDGKLHILDMKAKKDATIDMFDNRRDYTYQLNGYRQIIDLIPGLDGKVEDLHLLWFNHSYPKSGDEATYITQDDGTVLVSTRDVNKAPIEYFNGWTTPSLREDDEDAFVPIGLDSPLIDPSLLSEIPAVPVPVVVPEVKPKVVKAKRNLGDSVPKIGRDSFDVQEDSDRTKLIKAFSAQQRKYRVEMMAKDFSRHLARLVKKEQQTVSQRIDELKKNGGSQAEITELEEQKEALFDDKKAKKEVISKYGIPMILDAMKANYRQLAEMSPEDAARRFGERADFVKAQYRSVLDCFMPLMQEVAPMLERNGEPVRFIFSKQTYYTGNGTSTVDGGSISDTTSEEADNENQFGDDPEAKRATGNDGWAFEAKFTEPHLTLTQAVKQLLGDLKRTNSKGKVEYDDLGNIRYVPERFAYASLLAELSQIIDADDFSVRDENGNYSFPALERLQYIPQYSWVQQIIKKFKRDPSLASQFFRNFRKDAVIYRTQKWDKEKGIWKAIALNELTAEDAAMNALKRNWNNMIPQHPDSVFTNTGEIIKANAIKGVTLADSLLRDLPFIELDTDAGIAELSERVNTLTRMLGFRPDSISVEKLLGENALANINTVVGIIKNIFNGIKGNIPANIDIVDYFSSGSNYGMRGFPAIAEKIGVVSETDHIQIFRLNDKDRPTYGAPDYSTKIVKSLKRDDKRYQVLDRFKQDSFFYNAKTKQWRNELFRLLEDEGIMGNEVRAALATLDVPAIGDGPKAPYNKWSPFDIKTSFIRQYFFSPVSAKAPIQFGWYNFPIFSDTEMARFIRLPRYIGNFKEQMTPMFRELVKQELVRIDRVTKRRELIKQGKVQKIPNYDDNGHKFFFLPSLNDLEGFKETAVSLVAAGDVEALNSYIDSILTTQDGDGVLDKEFQEFLYGISSEERAALVRDLTHEGVISSPNDLDGALEEYFWNHHLATAQIIQLFTTDLAYYKDDNGVDFQKRWKEVFAGGEKLNTNSKYGKRTERSIILKDQEIVSNAYQHIKVALNEAVADNRLLAMDRDNILYKFRNVNATDGQGFRSLKSFRSILDMMGIWDEKMENAFNHFNDGVWTMEDFNLIWQTIKPYLFSNYLVPDGNGGMMNKPEQHKDSEFLLLSMYQLVAAGTKQSTKLKALNEWMDANDIDVVLFESAVKVGGQGAIDINYSQKRLSNWIKNNQADWDKIRKEAVNGYLAFNNIAPTTKSITEAENKVAEMSDMEVFRLGNDYMLDNSTITQDVYESRFAAIEPTADEIKNILTNNSGINETNKRGNPEVVHEIPYEDYCVQQPTPEHLFDVVDAVFGSQFRVLITADLPEDFKLKFYGDTLDKQGVINLWQQTITENLLDAYEKISGKFASIDALSTYLQDQVTSNSRYGRDLLDALQVIEVPDPTNKDRTKKVFNVPFNCPTVRAKIQELVLSAFKNQITKQTIHGGNAILVSNWGLTKELHVRHNKDGAVTGIECYLPAYSKSFYEAFMVTKTDSNGNTYQELDINKVPKDLLKGIGYRIPTEGKYSMVPLIIKGFLPQQNGSSIMLPADITTLSGSDFDIDKLFLMLPNFDVVRYNMRAAREDYAKEDALFKEVLPKIFSSEGAEDFTKYDSDSFKNWFERNKERYKYDKPLIRKVRYDSSKGITGNNKRRRDNMLIDLAFAILTHKDTARKLQNPGNFDKVKTVARINTLTNDPASIAMFAREYFGDLAEDASPEDIARQMIEVGRREGYKPLHDIAKKSAKRRSVLSLDTFVYNHQQNMAGASLIGMYANNDTSQAKHQSVPMSMATDGIMVNGKRIKNLTAFEVFDGKNFHLISKNCAEMLAAAVDNGKDPNLAALLQNDDTANILGTMLRAGLSIEEAGLLFNHPLIKRLLLAGNTDFDSFSKALDGEKAKYLQLSGATLPEPSAMVAYNFTSEEILTQTIKATLNPDNQTITEKLRDSAAQIRVATLFSEFMAVADLFGELTQCTRADSPNGALAVNLAEANIQRRRLTLLHRKARRADCPIIGLDDFISNNFLSVNDSKDAKREALYRSRQPMLQAFYSLGIDLAQDLIAKHFVEYEPFINDRVNKLHDNSATGILPKKALNAFYLDAFKYYMSASFADDAESYERVRDYYLNKYPTEFLRVIRRNPDLANIGIVRKLLYEKRSILLDKSSKIDSPTVEVLTRDFDLLMYDTENPEAQQLAMDLFCYCFFKNGLEFGPNNFGRFFSSNFLASIPRFIDRLRGMQGSMESDEFWDNMLDQFYMYHGMDYAVTPKIQGSNKDAPDGEGRSIYIEKVRNKNAEDEAPFEYIRYMEKDAEGKTHATLMKLADVGKTEGFVTYMPVKTVYVKDGRRYTPFMTADEIADLYQQEKAEAAERAEMLREYSAQRDAEDAAAEVARAANSRPEIPDHIAQSNPESNIPEGATNLVDLDGAENLPPIEGFDEEGNSVDNMSDEWYAERLRDVALEEAATGVEGQLNNAISSALELYNESDKETPEDLCKQ